MNERIRQLAEQAHKYANKAVEGTGLNVLDIAEQKFAELIVGECMDQVWYSREDGINGNISQVIKDRIKKHFGVE